MGQSQVILFNGIKVKKFPQNLYLSHSVLAVCVLVAEVRVFWSKSKKDESELC